MSNCKSAKEDKIHNSNLPKVEITSSEFEKRLFPKPKGEVSDYEFIFSSEELIALTEIIRDFEKKTSNEIAIVSIETIGNYTDFDKYALDLSNYWGIGQENKDNGLSIIFSKNLKKIRISTGNGTEKILTDKICKTVIDEIIIPEFKNGNYYLGISKGLSELLIKWR